MHQPEVPRHSPGNSNNRARIRERSAGSSRSNHRSRSPLRRETGESPHEFTGNIANPVRANNSSSYLNNCPIEPSLNLLVQALKSIAPDSDKINSVNNTIPEFDPVRKEQTMAMWLHKVNECASIYSWSEKQIVHFALPKLKGVAKRWYEGLPSVLFSWPEWQTKLLAAFPSDENYGQMLSDMLARRARFTDSLEDYFYDKIALINRCHITGKRAVECVLHGIDDRTVRLGAEAARFEDLDKLLTYLRNARSAKPNIDRKNVKSQPSANLDTLNKRPQPVFIKNRVLRCINCRREGHVASQCPLPVKKCERCLKIGHDTEKCYSNLLSAEKTVNRISGGHSTGDKYYKMALVNNIPFESFVDLGSECSMVNYSCFLKLGIGSLVSTELPVLRGFGNSVVHPLGRTKASIEIDGVGADTELLVVPDDVMKVPLMVGQTFTEQPHIIIRKTNNCLEISQLFTGDDTMSSRTIKIHCKEEVQVSGVTIIDVYTESTFSGDVFIEGGLRNKPGSCHYILTGLYRFNQGSGQIAVNGLCSFVIQRDAFMTRGKVAHQEVESSIMRVTAQTHLDQPKPISLSDVKFGDNLHESIKDNLLLLINTFRHCFAFTTSELGHSTDVEMSIRLLDDEPVVYRPYRMAVKEKEIVRSMIDELLENDIIRPSTSAYASPVILVKKKTGDYRLCIDYRALNKKTVKENYPMPLIDDQLDALSGHTYFTTLDLASGYYQIPIREQDKPKTGFVTPEGHYEFNRMPFGLANAPATFQRMMHQVLGTMRYKEALAYLDDIIIPSRDIAEGMERLKSVLQVLSSAGLTLKLSKCQFFGRFVDYLGFEVSSHGIKPGARKIEAVERFPTPINQHTVRQFLGLASFFRRFVQGFAVVAKPLTQLLKKNAEWVWGPDQQNSFQNLKNALLRKPILALYNSKADTELHTDACKIGVAGILLQRSEQNQLQPVAYFSKQTTPEEQNYSSYDLETLAVVASLQRFRVYLVGIHFKIVTDCNSLRATFSKRDMLPRVARWWTQMQEFNFDIEYRAGVAMAHVDALSRNPHSRDEPTECVAVNGVVETSWIITVQNADSDIQRIIGILNDPSLDDVTDIKSNYKMKGGKLFRITSEGDRWVVPKGVRWQVVKQNHDDIGHFALDKTLEKIKSHYWFPKMRRFVKKYVSSCLECAYSKTAGGKKPGFLHPIKKINIPFDTVHLDHVGPFVRSSKGNMYILVLIDAFTRYIYLKAVRNTKSSTSIRVLREYIGIFGVPRRIISDRGTSFTSESFKNFVSDKGIQHILNAVATPRANGQVERYNKVIVDALTAKSINTADTKWDDHLPDVQWGINNTFNKGINRTPAEALFGIRPKGPSDSRLLSAIDDGVSGSDTNLDVIRHEISTYVETSQQHQKNRYDRSRCKPIQYKVGDLIRVERQVPATGSSRKLVPKFQGPYKISKVYNHDRYQVEDTPMTRKGKKKYSAVIAVDKIKPWLSFSRPHDDILSDENSDC